LRNEKHVINVIAQINYVLLMLSLSLVRHFFNSVVSLVAWKFWASCRTLQNKYVTCKSDDQKTD